MVTRRVLMAGGLAGLGVAFALRGRIETASAVEASSPAEAFPIRHTEAEWRKLLTANQFTVLRRSGTERPYTSALNEEHRHGVFSCVGCGTEAFASMTKFDSGTGWPSFWAPIEKAVGETEDRSLGMMRTAVHCSQCGGHLGHVFNDGPAPTGLRYCMNGVAMQFKTTAA